MVINIIPKGGEEEKEKKKFSIEFLFFVALNVLVLPFSAYQTYVGYEADVAGHWIGAAVVATISAVLFAAMNFGIHGRRERGEKHHWQTILYIIPLGLSFFGNFNAFYSNQMRNQLYEEEINNYYNVLSHTKDDAKEAYGDWTGLKELETTFSSGISQLQLQYDGRGGVSGWGDACKKDWKNLKRSLENANHNGSKITQINAGARNPCAAAIRLATNFFNEIKKSKANHIKPLIAAIDSVFIPLDKKIISAKKEGKINSDGEIILDEIVRTNNNIGASAKAWITTNNGTEFNYEVLNPSDHNQIGTIKHTLTNAVIKKKNPTASVFALFLSLLIDLSALLYILLFVDYNRKGNKKGRIRTPRNI